MTNNTRYWPRVGMYVTLEFAEQWIERMGSESSMGGKFLDDDVEEYVAPQMVKQATLREEIQELFSQPFTQVELDDDIKSIILLTEMESNKVSRIKELKAEGYELSEAKEMVQSEINQAVADALDIDIEEYQERENARIEEARNQKEGANEEEAPFDDGEE